MWLLNKSLKLCKNQIEMKLNIIKIMKIYKIYNKMKKITNEK